MARIAGCFRPGVAPASWSLARSTALGCGICCGTPQQLSVDDRFFFGELYVSATGTSQGLRWALANGPRGFCVTAVPHGAAHRLVMDNRLRGWIGFATDLVGEHGSRCCSLFGFPVHVCLVVVLLSVPAAAILGVWRGWQGSRISFRAASVFALTMTALMISAWSNDALWAANWVLVGPAWYLAAGAWRSGHNGRGCRRSVTETA
jgi:hypothetical protein